MSDTRDSPSRRAALKIDTSVPHAARIWNYWLGGEDNFEADRVAGDRVRNDAPAAVDSARAFRHFLARAVRYLTADVGLRQFLDVGSGLPTVDSTHEVAQRVAAECRVVYVDNDPAVVTHARDLLRGASEATTAFIAGDVHDTSSIVRAARESIDFEQPVGLILSGILGYVDYTAARSVVRRLMYELVPGSYVVLCDSTVRDDALEVLQNRRTMRNSAGPGRARYRPRSRQEIAAYFDGLELVGPGVVACWEWSPDPGSAGPREDGDAVGGVGRKP